jgi:hypothetical protein
MKQPQSTKIGYRASPGYVNLCKLLECRVCQEDVGWAADDFRALKNLSDKRTNRHAFIYIPRCCIFESFFWEYFTASANFITSVNKPMMDQSFWASERSLFTISSDVTPEDGILYAPRT